MTKFERNTFERDLRACLAAHDARAAENAAARASMKANPALCAVLLAEAQRRGRADIDWPEYFRNADVNYP